jgi:hypothetical protein
MRGLFIEYEAEQMGVDGGGEAGGWWSEIDFGKTRALRSGPLSGLARFSAAFHARDRPSLHQHRLLCRPHFLLQAVGKLIIVLSLLLCAISKACISLLAELRYNNLRKALIRQTPESLTLNFKLFRH